MQWKHLSTRYSDGDGDGDGDRDGNGDGISDRDGNKSHGCDGGWYCDEYGDVLEMVASVTIFYLHRPQLLHQYRQQELLLRNAMVMVTAMSKDHKEPNTFVNFSSSVFGRIIRRLFSYFRKIMVMEMEMEMEMVLAMEI